MLFLKSLAFTHFSLCAIQKGIHTNSFLMLHRSHSVSGTRGESGVWKPCRICHLGSFSVFILILLSYKHQALEGESPTWPIFFFFSFESYCFFICVCYWQNQMKWLFMCLENPLTKKITQSESGNTKVYLILLHQLIFWWFYRLFFINFSGENLETVFR